MNPRKTADYSRKAYYEGLMQYNSKGERIRLEKIVELVGVDNKVLDIGCYNGTIGGMLIKKGNKVYGIEINHEVAEISRQRGLIVKEQDIESHFDFKSNFFDVIVAGEVIEHILDTDFFIDEIKRVLKPNGFLVLSTPNIASLGRRFLLLLGKRHFFEASFEYPPEAHVGHIRFFTKELLLNYLKHKGFEIIKFTSTIINFSCSENISSKLLVKLFPTFGSGLIVKARLI